MRYIIQQSRFFTAIDEIMGGRSRNIHGFSNGTGTYTPGITLKVIDNLQKIFYRAGSLDGFDVLLFRHPFRLVLHQLTLFGSRGGRFNSCTSDPIPVLAMWSIVQLTQ
jgi:hypothetical protein